MLHETYDFFDIRYVMWDARYQIPDKLYGLVIRTQK